MKLKLLIALIGLFSFITQAQVGVGTTIPQSQLDIRSSNQATPSNTDGVLIPKIDVFPAINPTAAQQGMLVYLTTTTTFLASTRQPGFYYWNNPTSDWVGLSSSVNGDHDWYEEGTSIAPNAISDEMYHTGNVAIGKTTTDYPLDIQGTTNRTLNVVTQNNTTDATVNHSKHTLYFGSSADAVEVNRTVYSGTSTGTVTGNSLQLNASGSTLMTGSSNVIVGTTNGAHIGVVNDLGSSTLSNTGVLNRLNNSATNSQKNGVENEIYNSTGNGAIIGVSNLLGTSGSGLVYGSQTNIIGGGSGLKFGNSTVINSTGTGNQYGNTVTLTGSNPVNNIGNSINITNGGGGNQTGTEIFLLGGTAGIKAGQNIFITNNGNGQSFGSSSVLLGTGTGNATGTSVAINTNGGGDQTGSQISLSGGVAGIKTGQTTSITNNGSGDSYSQTNSISGSSNSIASTISNFIFNSGTGLHYGMRNVLSGTGNGLKHGVRNELSGGGTQFGEYNTLSGNGTGTQWGTYNEITNTGNAAHTGYFTTLTGAGTGNKTGLQININPTAGGTHWGIYSEVLKPGATNFAGYFLGNVGIGTTGANTYTLPASRGLNGQIMQTDGLGNVTWQNNIANNAWFTTGNAGTNGGTTLVTGTNFIGTTDNQNLDVRTNNVFRARFSNLGEFFVGTLNTVLPGDLMNGVGNAAFPWAVNGYTNFNGAGVYGQITGGTSIYAGVQGEYNGTNAQGAGVRGIALTATAGTNFTAPHTGVTGNATTAGTYKFGVFGSGGLTTRSGGVLGNDFGILGALGYYAFSAIDYSVYGFGQAYQVGIGTGRFSNSQNTLSERNTHIGLGIYGGVMGGWVRGLKYGFHAKGETYSLYVDGSSYINKPMAYLIPVENSSKVATYVATAINPEVTVNGKVALLQGKVFVPFDKSFKAIISSIDDVVITATPQGKTNGVYIDDISQDGFWIYENNDGVSNAKIAWIAITKIKGQENVQVPQDLMDNDFDKKMEGVMFNENNTIDTPQSLWWDGTQMRWDMPTNDKEDTETIKLSRPKELKVNKEKP